MSRKQLTPVGYEKAASKFKLLSDPSRLRILDLLRRQKEMSVGDIQEALGCSQPTASRQLAKLHKERFLTRRREDTTVYYSITDESVFELCEAMCGRLEREACMELGALYELEEEDEGEGTSPGVQAAEK